MSHRLRVLSGVAVSAAALAVAAPVASAAPVSTPNACYSADGSAKQYATLPLFLEPQSVTQNGRQLEVGQLTPTVTIGDWLKNKLNQYPIGLAVGYAKTDVPVTAWTALSASGSTDGPQVVKTTGNVTLTFSNPFAGGTGKVTNVALSLKPSPATSWHATDAGGTLSVGQAPAGSLASVPELNGTPTGSLFIRGTVAAVNTTISIDCQPGTNSNSADPASLTPDFVPGTPATLASSVFSAVPVATPTPTAAPVATPTPTLMPTPAPSAGGTPTATPTSTPKPTATPTPTPKTAPLSTTTLAITSTALKFGSAAVLVNVSCPAGSTPCAGTATITSAKKLKVKGPAKIQALASGAYSVPAGTTGVVKLKLTAAGIKLRKTALVAKVTLKPSSGVAIAKTLRANG